jgi:hypothetical protein
MGTGTALSDAFTNVYIDCTVDGADITVKDLYISNTVGTTNMVDYQGQGNNLRFAGTSILDMNTGASGFAMVHVNSSTSLVVGGVTSDDTLYFYKREQGAGIGGNGGASGSEGQAPEYNGTITIKQGNLFMKNSKQGALIGSGAGASSTQFVPGPITIEGGTINIIAISRGAAIGGSAGSSGGAKGTDVYVSGGTINTNVDFSGAAIGGGGYQEGNDSDGGVLHYSGGSIRTYADVNAVDPNGDGDTSDSLWRDFGIFEAGVYPELITADKVDKDNNPLYFLALDVVDLVGVADSYTVISDGTQLYSGGLHRFANVNEALHKDSQLAINYTIDNWTPLDDPHLYVYVTGEDHTLSINGEQFSATFDAEAESFVVGPVVVPPAVGAPGSGDINGDGYITAAEALMIARAVISGAAVAGLDSDAKIAAADIDGDGHLTMADVVRTLRRAAGLP